MKEAGPAKQTGMLSWAVFIFCLYGKMALYAKFLQRLKNQLGNLSSIAHTSSHYSTMSMSDHEPDLESDHIVKIDLKSSEHMTFDENLF